MAWKDKYQKKIWFYSFYFKILEFLNIKNGKCKCKFNYKICWFIKLKAIEVKTAYMKFDDFNKPLALQVIFVHESDK